MSFNQLLSVYEKGSVYELKVQKILVDAQLIIFDLGGVSAHLHVSELSNNPELSNKLFNIIRVDEMITAVIIDFNQEKECVELSLRPFRNQLEGTIGFMKCRKIVQERAKSRVNQEGDYLEENRNQLDRIQGDLAKVDLTFLYELIQNAIDHPNSQFDNLLSIKFEVFNDYLLLKHNGSLFTEDNFRSLTGILLGEAETDQDRIGYKGIGFKSIFRYTQEVYIRSGNFSFSFSKTRSGARMPWEVIPIFENEIDKVEELKNFEFFNTPVAFAFKFTNSELKDQAIKYLEQLIAKPETLLFLDKLGRLEIVVDGNVKKITREVIDCDSYEKINLQMNEESLQEWIVCKESKIITEDSILNELKDENNPSIPLKFRNFRRPQVQVAFPSTPRMDLINMYAYLPLSETSLGLPYIVNGDFIPNLDRTDLIKNLLYNNSLATMAADVLSKLFKIVSKEYGIDSALTLIPQFDTVSTDFFSAVNKAFIPKQDELTIVLPSNQEVPLKDFVIDRSRLFTILKKEEIRFHEKFSNSYVFDELSTTTAAQLSLKLGVREFKIQDGIELLTKPEIIKTYCSSSSDALKLLFRFSELPNVVVWSKKIGFLEIINRNDKLFALKDLYVGVPEGFEKMFEKVLNIKAIDKEGSKFLQKHLEIVDRLVEFGLKEFKLDNMLRLFIRDLEKIKTTFNQEYINQIWHFLYLNRNEVNADGSVMVNERFKQFPIITIDRSPDKLENCFAGDVDQTGKDYFFLHDHYGKDHLKKVDITSIAELVGVKNQEIIEFLSTIHDKVKLTDKVLFKGAFKKICSRQKEKIENDVLIKSLLSVFSFSINFPQENLLEYGMLDFPVLTQSNEIEKISFTYFDSDYSSYIAPDELYAEQLFQSIGKIQFISKKYIENISEEERVSFTNFLRKYHVSPGLKYFKSGIFRKYGKINLSEIDYVYFNLYKSAHSFQNNDDFYIFRDVYKLSGLYENLKIFWTELVKITPADLFLKEISCNGFPRNNPLVWLLKTDKEMFPTHGGAVRSFKEIHSKELDNFIFESSYKLNLGSGEKLDYILDKLDFNTTLSNAAIISCLQNFSDLPIENRIKVINYFIGAKFNDEEIELIKTTGFLIAKDDSIQKAEDLIYLDEALTSSSLVLEQTTFPEKFIMKTFKHHQGFRKKIDQLTLTIKGIDQIELRDFSEKSNSNSQNVSAIIYDFAAKNNSSEPEIEVLKESKFIICDKIMLGLIGIPDFHANVDSYYNDSSNTYYYTEIRDLIDLLCDKFNWPISLNKRLRKEFENVVTKKKDETDSTKKSMYSDEEIAQIKHLFGRELADSELEEENLYAHVKALRYLKDQSYDITRAESEFEDNFKKKLLYPVIDQEGRSYKVMCRSARKGILFFGAFAWTNLGEENTLLYVLTGDKSSDCILIKSQEELEKQFDSHYKVLRRENTSYIDLRNLISAESQLSDLQLLYKVKGSSFDLIFNPQKTKPGVTSGPLTDIGEDI